MELESCNREGLDLGGEDRGGFFKEVTRKHTKIK